VTRFAATRRRTFPELGAGGFSRCDGSVEFYTRVNALVDKDSVVVDFGAGRGRFLDEPVRIHRELQHLKGRVDRVIGLDVDPAVLENEALDEAAVIEIGKPLPVDDESVDLVVSDFTFEHVEDPGWASTELSRILRPGGWLCARTPNRYGSIAVPARIIPNRWHDQVLSVVQPRKRTRDTFPTHYRLNTRKALENAFPPSRFDHHSYTYEAEPAYVGSSALAWSVAVGVSRLVPRPLQSMHFVFVRKRDEEG
jgi:SAM-dependent methyltransferase